MFQEMSNKQYHATPAISASWLKLLAKSPYHLWHAYISKDRKESVQTAAMMLGSLTHTLVLEPEKLDSEYVIVPEGIDKRSKDGKAFFSEIEAGGKTPVKQADFDHCAAMADSLRSNPGFLALRQHKHENERTFFWDDETTGLYCKMRPDTVVHPCAAYPNGVVTDVKTTADASPAGFGRQFFALGYHIQAAHNAIGFMQAFGTDDPPLVVFECVEKDAPHVTQCYQVPDDVLEYGFRVVAELMDTASGCFKHDTWPGYTQEVFPELSVPGWIRREMEESGEIEVSYVEGDEE